VPRCCPFSFLQDTVAVQELRFGDNDTLSAQVATLVEADYLFLMTDVDALYTANPKVGGSGRLPRCCA
jgi:glutamate 5-kinase